MADVNCNPGELDTSRLVIRLRDSWIVLSEVQLALEQDDSREQDRRNRFNHTLDMVLEQQDELLQALESRFRG
ncbi:MAG: hypothetical protein ACSLFJ_15305 [Immundisolibacter sp.]|uniref:hypothetical protein n=1 Tax=Immundisolibacter sp. TaxID=1934948 RepID=UPI003EE36274